MLSHPFEEHDAALSQDNEERTPLQNPLIHSLRSDCRMMLINNARPLPSFDLFHDNLQDGEDILIHSTQQPSHSSKKQWWKTGRIPVQLAATIATSMCVCGYGHDKESAEKIIIFLNNVGSYLLITSQGAFVIENKEGGRRERRSADDRTLSFYLYLLSLSNHHAPK